MDKNKYIFVPRIHLKALYKKLYRHPSCSVDISGSMLCLALVIGLSRSFHLSSSFADFVVACRPFSPKSSRSTEWLVSYPIQPIPGHSPSYRISSKRLYPLCSNGFRGLGLILVIQDTAPFLYYESMSYKEANLRKFRPQTSDSRYFP